MVRGALRQLSCSRTVAGMLHWIVATVVSVDGVLCGGMRVGDKMRIVGGGCDCYRELNKRMLR